MKNGTLGMMISSLRKSQEMTQLELAEQMGVTDKAVSKWERDISCPDVNSLPKLAEILGVSVDELMQSKTKEKVQEQSSVAETIQVILKAIPVAMGVAVTVLSALDKITSPSAFSLLGIGLACAGVSLLNGKH